MSNSKSRGDRRRFMKILGGIGAAAASAWAGLLPEARAARGSGVPPSASADPVDPPTTPPTDPTPPPQPVVSDLSASRVAQLLAEATTNPDVAALVAMAPLAGAAGTPFGGQRQVSSGYTTETISIPYWASGNALAMVVVYGYTVFTGGAADGCTLLVRLAAFPNGTAYAAGSGQVHRASDPDLEAILCDAYFPVRSSSALPATFKRRETARFFKTREVDDCPFDVYTGVPRPGDPPNGPALTPCNAVCGGGCGSYPVMVVVGILLTLVCIGLGVALVINPAVAITLNQIGGVCAFALGAIITAMYAAQYCADCLGDCRRANEAACRQWMKDHPGEGA